MMFARSFNIHGPKRNSLTARQRHAAELLLQVGSSEPEAGKLPAGQEGKEGADGHRFHPDGRTEKQEF